MQVVLRMRTIKMRKFEKRQKMRVSVFPSYSRKPHFNPKSLDTYTSCYFQNETHTV